MTEEEGKIRVAICQKLGCKNAWSPRPSTPTHNLRCTKCGSASVSDKYMTKEEAKNYVPVSMKSRSSLEVTTDPNRKGFTPEPDAADYLDHEEVFKKVLTDCKLKKGLDSMTEVFFGGDTYNPLFLIKVLKSNRVPVPTIRLVFAKYWGKYPEDMGVNIEDVDEDAPLPEYKPNKAKKASGRAEGGLTMEDVEAEEARIDAETKLMELEEKKMELRFEQEDMKRLRKLRRQKMIKEYERSISGEPEDKGNGHTRRNPYQMITQKQRVDKEGNILYDKNTGAAIMDTVSIPVNPDTMMNPYGGFNPMMGMGMGNPFQQGNQGLSIKEVLELQNVSGTRDPEVQALINSYNDQVKALEKQMEDMRRGTFEQGITDELKTLGDGVEAAVHYAKQGGEGGMDNLDKILGYQEKIENIVQGRVGSRGTRTKEEHEMEMGNTLLTEGLGIAKNRLGEFDKNRDKLVGIVENNIKDRVKEGVRERTPPPDTGGEYKEHEAQSMLDRINAKKKQME